MVVGVALGRGLCVPVLDVYLLLLVLKSDGASLHPNSMSVIVCRLDSAIAALLI